VLYKSVTIDVDIAHKFGVGVEWDYIAAMGYLAAMSFPWMCCGVGYDQTLLWDGLVKFYKV